jgi:methylamine dehydrogenase accessory protein MauD
MDRFFVVSFAISGLLAVALGLTLVLTLWQLGHIHLKRLLGHFALITDDGPSLHELMPDFTGREVMGRSISLRHYRGRSLVVMFLSGTCDPCEQLMRVIRSTQRGLRLPYEFLAILEAPRSQAEEYIRRYRLKFPVILDEGGKLRLELGVERLPYALLVDPDGVVRMKGVTNGRRQLEALIAGRGSYVESAAWQVSPPAIRPDRDKSASI